MTKGQEQRQKFMDLLTLVDQMDQEYTPEKQETFNQMIQNYAHPINVYVMAASLGKAFRIVRWERGFGSKRHETHPSGE